VNDRLTRRDFLRVGAGTATLTLFHLGLHPAAAGVPARPGGSRGSSTSPGYTGYEDLYRRRWTWDRVVRGTHLSNCGYQRCAWNVYVKEGMVWREEQVAAYPQTNPDVPDFNPRGCQKGACYSDRMYDQARLRVPLKRVGKRGEGRWQRIGWEQALTEIADRFIDTIVSEDTGPGSIYWDLGSASANGCHALGLTRTGYLLDTPLLENTAEMGDHAPGVTTTAGKVIFTSSMDDLHYSDLILIWGGNPNYTHIPNAHFIYEARYKGAYLVAVAPDFSPSSIHADEWVPVNIGSDAALALSMAQVIVEEKLYKADFVAEQTDLSFLVRVDDGRFLRESDLVTGGADDVFHVYDSARNEVVAAPRRSLDLGEIRPALEGTFDVEGAQGPVRVTTVFERLKAHLTRYTPEQTAKTTGVGAAQVRRLARRIAGARACSNITQTSFSKYYHGMEMERAILLVFALTGHFGRRGAGYSAVPMLSVSGAEALSVASGSYAPALGIALMTAKLLPELARLKFAGYSNEMMVYHFAREDYARGTLVAPALLHYRHGGLEELYGDAKRWDPDLKRDFS
jgi:anaerobic selenocysteine-containing dehydrogenase